MAALTLLGLRKCSTCQKAEAALTEAGHAVTFRDVSQDRLSEDERRALLAQFGDKLVNRASLTWRAMTEAEREADPVAALGERPSLMKRPAIMDGQGGQWLGWTANVKRALGVPA